MAWHGNTLNASQWDDSDRRFLAYTLAAVKVSEADLHILFNMADAACEAELPAMPGRVWRRALDTSLDSPHDLPELIQQEALDQPRYRV